MNLQQHLDHFVTHGWTVFPAVHAEPAMQRWREAYAPLCRQASLPGQPPVTWLGNLFEADPGLFMPVVWQPQLLDFAEQAMGPFVQIDSTALNVFPTVDPAQAAGRVNGQVNGWHRDRYAFVPQTRDYIRPICLNTITYLQNLTAANGPLRVIPGSHRDPVVFSADERQRPHPREQLLEPKAGDVVVTHGLLAHSGTPNLSGQPRYFLSASLNLCWLRQRDSFGGPRCQALIADARARGDRRLLRLLGEDDQRWDRSNPYFHTDDDSTCWQRWVDEDRAALITPLLA